MKSDTPALSGRPFSSNGAGYLTCLESETYGPHEMAHCGTAHQMQLLGSTAYVALNADLLGTLCFKLVEIRGEKKSCPARVEK